MTDLRVLVVAHDHPDWTPGGTEVVAHDLARALARHPGVSATLLVASTSLRRPHAAPGSLGALGPDLVLHTGAYDRFSMTRLDGAAWTDGVAEALRRTRPDVVHLHGLDRLGAEVVPLVRRLRPRARVVLTLHDYQLVCPNDGLLLRVPDGARCRGAAPDRCHACFPSQPAARHALRRAHLLALVAGVDAFVTPSRFARDRVVEWGLDPARVHVLPNAVPALPHVPESVPGPARWRRNRFAFLGNVLPHKGALVLLDAAARLKEAGANVEVALHGGLSHPSPGFAAAFEAALAAARPLARHLGPYGRDEVARILAATDWVVVPSTWWENAPLVVLEAQAAGRPVICSGIGGMAEMVRDGETGIHVPPGDPVALAARMREAAEDPLLWPRLAGRLAAGRGGSEHPAFVARHLDLYRAQDRRAAA